MMEVRRRAVDVVRRDRLARMVVDKAARRDRTGGAVGGHRVRIWLDVC